MDKRKKLISLASGVAGLVLVASAIVLSQVVPTGENEVPSREATTAAGTNSTPTPEFNDSLWSIEGRTIIKNGGFAKAMPVNELFLKGKLPMERTFFEAATATCNKVKTQGVRIEYRSGAKEIIVGLAQGGYASYSWNPDGSVNGSWIYDFPPNVCAPFQLSNYVATPEGIIDKYLLEEIGGVFPQYMLHMHNGGSAEIGNLYVTVTDGMISSYFDASNFDDDFSEAISISFGLTQGQLNELKKADTL